jgi:hypothetical protein
MTVPEKPLHTHCGMSIRSVDALMRRVNAITDADSDPITTSARLDTYLVSPSEAPITIGNRGNMHGARTVSTPAKTEMTKKSILLNL